MSDLIVFLRARLAEDEAVARAATAGPWSVDDPRYAEAITAAGGVSVVAGGRWGGEASVFESTEDAVHIARHDPARVLTEVSVKRAILDLHDELETADWRDENDESTNGLISGLWRAISLLALPFANHPDYRSEWATNG